MIDPPPLSLPLPRLSSHGLDAPTLIDARLMVRSVADDPRHTLWEEVCAEVGLPAGGVTVDLDQLSAVAAALTARGGVVGLLGRSLGVRAATYRELAKVDRRGPRVSCDWARLSMERLLRDRPLALDRLRAIADLDLFSRAARGRLDRTAARFADRLGAPVGLVTVVAGGAQLIPGSRGLSGWVSTVGGLPVEWSLCATMVRTREPYVVPDLARDLLQRSNPAHVVDGIAGYAGVPLITSAGHVVGACCVASGEPLALGQEELDDMQATADALMHDLEAVAAGTSA